jgi:hypothetical protein
MAHALALLPVAMPAAAQAPGSPDARARGNARLNEPGRKALLGS